MSTLNHAVAFEKYHGAGNDFIIVDATDPVADRSTFAQTHCDRVAGVPSAGGGSTTHRRTGADGVLFLDLEDRFSPPRVIMTLVQPDGSVAPTCANGTRCAAVWAMNRTETDSVMIDTQAGTRQASRVGDAIAVETGIPSLEPRRVPLAASQNDPLIEAPIGGLTVTAITTGVPHAVAFVDDVDAVDLDVVAPPIRHADMFPAGVNVTIAAQTAPTDGGLPRFRQRTYERGIEGETDACGTGAVAISAVARKLGIIDADVAAEPTVEIALRGGDLQVTTDGHGRTQLTGPVVHEFDGDLPTPVGSV